VIGWPFVGVLYFWRSDRPHGKTAAVVILVGGLATYALVGSYASRTPDSPPPSPSPSAKRSLAPSRTPKAPEVGPKSACRAGDPLENVYSPSRLTVIDRCKTVTGVVKFIRGEEDGDIHFDLKLDSKFAGLINAHNRSAQFGYLVAEIVPADQPGCTVGEPPPGGLRRHDYGICTGANVVTPRVGAHVAITGPYVRDEPNGWMEIHPVWRVTYLAA